MPGGIGPIVGPSTARPAAPTSASVSMYWAHAVVSALDEESASDQQQLSSGEQFGNVEHLAGMHPADRRVEPGPAGHDGQSGGGHGRLVERVSQPERACWRR